MSEFSRKIESDEQYIKLLESLPKDQQERVAKYAMNLASKIDKAFGVLIEKMETKEGADEVLEEIAQSILKGDFDGNAGVTGLVWQEKN
jgi:hypothetical protein